MVVLKVEAIKIAIEQDYFLKIYHTAQRVFERPRAYVLKNWMHMLSILMLCLLVLLRVYKTLNSS